MISLRYEYDERTDIFTIEGVQYSGEFFRMLGQDGVAVDPLPVRATTASGLATAEDPPLPKP